MRLSVQALALGGQSKWAVVREGQVWTYPWLWLAVLMSRGGRVCLRSSIRAEQWWEGESDD